MSRIHEALKKAEQEQKVHSAITSVVDDALLTQELPETDLGLPEVAPNVAEESSADPIKDGSWLAEIQFHNWKPDVQRVLFSDPSRHHEPGMEQFRTLRSRLYQIREKTPIKTIMLASALPGEGKTFVSSNLAYALVRQHGRRVLVIDADVRKPHLHECIGCPDTPGLNEYLAGKADVKRILQRGPCENLFVIPGGRPVANPSELIGNGRLKLLLDKLLPFFDWVLLDSPPVVPISDGSIIARHVDGILWVVRAEDTPLEVLKRARQELKDRPMLGVVLNRSEEKEGYSSYYYSYGKSGQERESRARSKG